MFDSNNHYILTTSCASRLGTVAAISGFLAARECYIVNMQQFDDVLTDRFFMRTSFFTDRQKTPADELLREQFAVVAQREQMEWEIHEAWKKAARTDHGLKI